MHHAKGIHAYNYSDLPLLDILFDTFKNPAKFVDETGFYYGASARVKDMLLFKDIDKTIQGSQDNTSYKTPAIQKK